MPVKGIIFICIVVITCAIIERDKIYRWLTSEFSDDNIEESNNNTEKEQEK